MARQRTWATRHIRAVKRIGVALHIKEDTTIRELIKEPERENHHPSLS